MFHYLLQKHRITIYKTENPTSKTVYWNTVQEGCFLVPRSENESGMENCVGKRKNVECIEDELKDNNKT